MLSAITTGQDDEDRKQISRYANLISQQQKTNIDDVIIHLNKLKEEYLKAIEKGVSRQESLDIVTEFAVTSASLTAKGGFLVERGINAAQIVLTTG